MQSSVIGRSLAVLGVLALLVAASYGGWCFFTHGSSLMTFKAATPATVSSHKELTDKAIEAVRPALEQLVKDSQEEGRKDAQKSVAIVVESLEELLKKLKEAEAK